MNTILGLGIAITIGFLVGKLIEFVKIPSVAGYIIAGLILGKSFLGIIDSNIIESTTIVSDVALAIIAFSIGGELIFSRLKEIGFRVFLIAFAEGSAAFILVFLSMLALGQSLPISLLLGAVASATAPAATVMVLNELRCEGPLTSTLIAVVAIDDVICLIIYAIASSVAKVFIQTGESISVLNMILGPVVEIGGSILLGLATGGLLILLLRKFSRNKEVLALIIAMIFVTIGVAYIFNLSTLLSNMTVGILVSNFSKRRLKAFMVLESVTTPLYICFFVLAGARLDIALLGQVGLVGLVYTVARMIGKISGASVAAAVTKAEPAVRKYIGFGLLSQVGVAVGLAIVISHEFAGTNIGDVVITVLLATTVITEIVGPLMTKLAVVKSKEAYCVENYEEANEIEIVREVIQKTA